MGMTTGKRAGAGSRRRKLDMLLKNNFTCDCGVRGQDYCSVTNYTDLLLDSKFIFSPAGNGWSNYRQVFGIGLIAHSFSLTKPLQPPHLAPSDRDWESVQFGAVALLDYHPSFSELYKVRTDQLIGYIF